MTNAMQTNPPTILELHAQRDELLAALKGLQAVGLLNGAPTSGKMQDAAKDVANALIKRYGRTTA